MNSRVQANQSEHQHSVHLKIFFDESAWRWKLWMMLETDDGNPLETDDVNPLGTDNVNQLGTDNFNLLGTINVY